MDNSNEPTNAPESQVPQQEAAPVTYINQQEPAKQSRNNLKTVAIFVGVLLLLILIPVAYALGRMQSADNQKNTVSTGTDTTKESAPTETIENTSDEVSSEYAGWKTYENEVYGYALQYPADWQVDRQVIQGKADWVSVNPADLAHAVGPDVVAIHTYFDGTGCPETKTKEFVVGEYTVEGASCIDEELYKIAMKHSKVVSVASGVVLAAIPQNMVGIMVDMSKGEDEKVQQVLKSITGLTPIK